MGLRMSRAAGPVPFRRGPLLLACCVLLLDQGTKAWVLRRVDDSISILPNFFSICRVLNNGAAWNLFAGHRLFLAVVGLVALGLLFVWRRRLGPEARRMDPCLGLLAGGIVGNLLDRIFRGQVVDFLDFNLGLYHWPAFNVADLAISVGVIFLLWTGCLGAMRNGD